MFQFNFLDSNDPNDTNQEIYARWKSATIIIQYITNVQHKYVHYTCSDNIQADILHIF